MTRLMFEEAAAMTGEQYLALGETPEQIELFDGSLVLHLTEPVTAILDLEVLLPG
ncbi:hypothetical protein [Actinoplanes solisilvae]|uniref:hypothetical protein n=1 Tax=Actinoplanes solisilvae TaxID=2486853 RepID=UPI0013E2CED3|nr:hypothetical protein [Actinoplanes solisilvae]